MISIIVPVYNVSQYIREAVNSLTSQTYSDIEIILVDDGSTDGSGSICDEYQRRDDRIRVVHQKNRGLSAARNTGLDICVGDIIAFLDSDDAYHPDMLLRMYEAMEKTGADVVECCYSIYLDYEMLSLSDIEKNKCSNQGIKHAGVFTRHQAFQIQVKANKNNACIWNKIYKRMVWDNLRFREGMNHEDVEIILPLIERAEKFCIIDDALIMYRIRPGSISNTHSIDNARDLSLAYDHYAEYIKGHIPEYFDEDDLISIYEKHYYEFLSRFFLAVLDKRPDRKEYMKYLRTVIAGLHDRFDVRAFTLHTRVASWIYLYTPAIVPGVLIQLVYLLGRCITKVVPNDKKSFG